MLLIKLEDGGPVFYSHRRVSYKGRIINFIKFRSMEVNAESKQTLLLSRNLRPDLPLFKIENDPRLTKIGRILRSFNLDELPQLLLVFKGELSLIGPRPHLVEEVRYYRDYDYLKLDCTPGLAALPQLYDNGQLSFKEWIKLDLTYRKNWSLMLDLKILAKICFNLVRSLFTQSLSHY